MHFELIFQLNQLQMVVFYSYNKSSGYKQVLQFVIQQLDPIVRDPDSSTLQLCHFEILATSLHGHRWLQLHQESLPDKERFSS